MSLKIGSIKDFTRGWFIGNFQPSILQTTDFEVGIIRHQKGEYIPLHLHKKAPEYIVMISGKMIINGELLETGDVFSILPYQVSDASVLEDTVLVVVKVPATKDDKYELIYK